MMQDQLESFSEEHYPEGCIFQQDRSPSHESKMTRDYFMDSQITDIAWTDINCIENLWGILSLRLYKSGCQFDTKEDLDEAHEWDKIQISDMRSLIKSKPRRATQCLEHRGRVAYY